MRSGSFFILLLSLAFFQINIAHANPLEKKLRSVLEIELKKNLGHSVKIQQIQGNLLQRAILKDVQIGSFLNIQSLRIEYSLPQLLLGGGDFLKAIKKIEIDRVDGKLIRGRQGLWNFETNTLPSSTGNANLKGFEFPILIRNAHVFVKDSKGYLPSPLSIPFQASVHADQIQLQFKKTGWLWMESQLILRSQQKQFPAFLKVKTTLDGKNYSIDLSLPQKSDLSPFWMYFQPVPGMKLHSLWTSGKLSLKPSHNPEWPFDLSGKIQLETPETEYQNLIFQNIRSTLAFDAEGVHITNTRIDWDQNPMTLSGRFHPSQIALTLQLPAFQLGSLHQIKELKDIPITGQTGAEIKISGTAKDPELYAELSQLQGQIYKRPLQLKHGKGIWSKKLMELQLKELIFCEGQGFGLIRSSEKKTLFEFDLQKVNSKLLFLSEKWHGLGDLKVQGTGLPQDFKAQVKASLDQIYFGKQPLGQILAQIHVKDQQIEVENIEMNHPTDPKQQIHAAAKFNLEQQKFWVKLEPSSWILDEFEPTPSVQLSGEIQLAGSLQGSLKSFAWKEWDAQMNLKLKNALIMSQWIEKLESSWDLKSGFLNLKSFDWQSNNSQVKLKGKFSPDSIQALEILPGSHFDLNELDYFSKIFPEINAQISIAGKMQGSWKNPDFEMNMQATDLSQNSPEGFWLIPRIALSAQKNGQSLSLPRIEMNYQDEQFAMNLDLTLPSVTRVFWESEKFHIEKWKDLSPQLLSLWEKWKLRQEETLGPTALFSQNQFNWQLNSTQSNQQILFSRNQSGSELEQFHYMIQKYFTQQQKQVESLPLKGLISGQVEFSLQGSTPHVESNLKMENFQAQELAFKNAVFKNTSPSSNELNLSIQDLSLSRNAFEQMDAQMVLEPKQLKLSYLDLTQNKQKHRILKGDIPFQDHPDHPLHLYFHFPSTLFDSFMNLLPGIAKVKGVGQLDLEFKGALSKIQLVSQNIELTGTEIYFTPDLGFKSPLKIANQKTRFDAGQLFFEPFVLEWKGEDTDAYLNRFAFSGQIDLRSINLNNALIPVSMNLSLQDGHYQFNLPSMYKGKMDLKNIRIQGSYPIALSRKSDEELMQKIARLEPVGPKVSGEVWLEDGELIVAKRGPKSQKAFLEMDLALRLGNGMSTGVEGGVIGTDLSNLLTRYHFELTPDAVLNVKGNLNFPRMDGSLGLTSGYLAIFNRNFELTNTQRQREFFTGDMTRIKKNQIYFKPMISPYDSFAGSIYFSMAAETTLYNTVSSANIQPSENIYLVLVDGPLSDFSAIAFEKYQSEQQKPVRKIGETLYLSEPQTGKKLDPDKMEALLSDLAPQVLKNMLLAQKKTHNSQDTEFKNLAKDLTAEQVNQLFRQILRPAERNLAKSVGLYDIQVRRDFTGEVQQLFDQGSSTLKNSQKVNIVQVAFISEILKDRLYLTLNTQVDNNLNTSALDFKITSYKLALTLLRNLFLDELRLSYQYSYLKEDLPPQNTYLLEGDHHF